MLESETPMSSYVRKHLDPETLGQLAQQPPVCDFCGLHAPEWVYAARKMSTGEHRVTWRWCACPECALKVEAGDWDAIAAGIRETLSRAQGLVMPRSIVYLALEEFHFYALRTSGQPHMDDRSNR